MSITLWTSYQNLAFKINPGPNFKDDKERLKFISGKIPIYKDDKFNYWELPKDKLNKLFEIYQNAVLIQPDAKEYIDFYKLQTSRIDKLPKIALTVKSLDGKNPRPYQYDCITTDYRRKGLLWLLDTSAGKTLIGALRAANLTFEKLLITCPLNLVEEWQTSIQEILGLSSTLYKGTKKQREKIDLNLNPVIICNFEMLKDLNSRGFTPDSIICDEAHLVGSPSTIIYKEFKKIVRRAQKEKDASVQLMTATPMENSLEELWYLINLVNQELAGDKTVFLNKFQDAVAWVKLPSPNGGTFKKATRFKTKNEQELKELLACAGMRVPKSVFMSQEIIPPEIVTVKMTKAQAKVYDEVREELVLLAQDRTFFLNNPLVKLGKSLEAAEGAYNIYPEMVEESGKMKYIVKELNDKHIPTNRKAVIWFRYKEGSNILHSYYPNCSVLRNGDQPAAMNWLAKKAFQGVRSDKELEKYLKLKEKYNFPHMPGEALFLISTYSERSGVGDNFQSADIQYFMSLDYSATSFNQAANRIIRQDSLFDKIHTKIVVSEESIEAWVFSRLFKKIENNSRILDGFSAQTTITARDVVKELMKS